MSEESHNIIESQLSEAAFSCDGQAARWEPDVLAMLLADKRSENTRRAYRHDIGCFFRAVYEADLTPDLLRRFLALNTLQMTTLILRYKARLVEDKRTEATINRRLSALKSLIKLAKRVGATEADLHGNVDAEKVVAYRDTRGITLEQARLVLRQPDRSTLKGRRDYALLLLLLENALRRAEIVGLSMGDFEAESQSLWILGKGRGTQRERLTISPLVVSALNDYLMWRADRGHPNSPLFTNVSPAAYGRPLTADGLYKIVKEAATAAGLNLRLSPHRLRHTAITMALDASDGDIRQVQRLSRHTKMETLQIYDDNRTDLQGKMTNLLSQLLNSEP